MAASLHAVGEPVPSRKVTYKITGETELQLHIFNPSKLTPGERRPAIVFFFGGGWRQGTPTQFYPHCAHFASTGMVAVAAEYRVESRDGTDPRTCVEDGKSAMRWVRSHAAELGIDPDRIAAGGGSAGGHVAAASALVEGFNDAGDDVAVDCRPNALVLFNPVFDNGPGGYGHDRVEPYWREISPLHNIKPGAPPTVVFLGTADLLVPVATAVQYQQRMLEAGARCDLHLYGDQPHGFFNFKNPAYYRQTLGTTAAFLESLGYLPSLSSQSLEQ
jgi:acetyl esterase/lipase